MTYCILIPGFHDGQLTHRFIQSFNRLEKFWVFPDLPSLDNPADLIVIGFSAGVIGAIAAAWAWQFQGHRLKALIALDGWGVPLGGNFPIHRCSHDYFTHWSSALLGSGTDNFYAEPAVEHLELWGKPAQVTGWRVTPEGKYFMTLTNYLESLLNYYD